MHPMLALQQHQARTGTLGAEYPVYINTGRGGGIRTEPWYGTTTETVESQKARLSRLSRSPAQRVGSTLNDEPVVGEDGKTTCACTASKVVYGLVGVLGGLAVGWALNDEVKGTIKSTTKAAAARAADRAAARLRR